MENNSGLIPLGRAVLVDPYEPQQQQGAIIIPDSVTERSRMAEQRAVVVAVGPECWKEESQPRAKPGDHVMVSKYAGHLTPGMKDGKMYIYRVVNANDIFLRIDPGVQQ